MSGLGFNTPKNKIQSPSHGSLSPLVALLASKFKIIMSVFDFAKWRLLDPSSALDLFWWLVPFSVALSHGLPQLMLLSCVNVEVFVSLPTADGWWSKLFTAEVRLLWLTLAPLPERPLHFRAL